MKNTQNLKGVVAVLFCPYTKQDKLDLKGLIKNTQFLLDFASEGHKPLVIMTNGSTTESYANTQEEQKQVIRTVTETVAGKVPVIAGVSQSGTKLTIELAKYAEKAGADYAMVAPPYYHHASQSGLFRHYQAVAGAIDIGVVVYNNAAVSATLMPPDFLFKLAEIKNIVACKDNSVTFSDLANKALTIIPDNMALLAGQGEMQYLAAASYGFKYRGFVSYIANFAPALSYAVYEAVQNKDFDRAFQELQKQAPLWQFVSKIEKKRESLSVIPGGLK